MRRTLLLALIVVMLIGVSITSVIANPTRGRAIGNWSQWVLDPASPSYTPRDHMGSVVARNAWNPKSVTPAVTSVDCIYLIGGRTAVDPNDPLNPNKGTVTGRVERFNPSTNAIEILPDLPHPRMNAAAVYQTFVYWRQDPANQVDPTKRVKDETQLIYVFGGTDGQGNPVTAVDVFNNQSQTWNDTATPVLSLNDPANPLSGQPAYWDTTVDPPVLTVMVATDTNDKITDSGKRGVASALPAGMDAPMITEFNENQSGNNTGFVSPGNGPNPDPYKSPYRFHIISTSPTPTFYLYDYITDSYRLASDTTDPGVIPAGTVIRPGPLPADIPVLKGACGMKAFDAYGGRGGWYNYIIGGQKSDGTASAQAWRGSMRHKDEGWTSLPDMQQPVSWAAQMTNYARPRIFTGDQTDMQFVVGGNIALGVYSNKVQAYISGPYRQWFMTSPTEIFPFGLDMPEARGERPVAAVITPTGAKIPAIFVFGGQTSPGNLAASILKADINGESTNYSPYIMPADRPDRILKRWERIADMPTPRSCSPSAVVDGKVYVIGGFKRDAVDLAKQITTTDVECYDTATNTWSAKAPLIWKVKDAQAVAVGRKIFIMSGKMDDTTNFPVSPTDATTNPPTNPPVSNNIMQIYDVDTNTWTASVLKDADGNMIKNPDGTPWINPDCPPLPANAVSSAVCATSDGLIHVLGGTMNGGNTGSATGLTTDVWARNHSAYDPTANKWYRNVRTIDAEHPFMCPELVRGHQNQGAEVICDYDASGNKTHEWIYLACGRTGTDQNGDIYRLDWMACKNWTTPMPLLWSFNNDLNALWDDQGTFTDPKGWPEWQQMIPVNKTGTASGDGEAYKGFAGSKNQAGHAVITDRYGVKRVMVFGGWDNDVDNLSRASFNVGSELYPDWRGTQSDNVCGDSLWVLAYHAPEEPLPVSNCTTYECHMPLGKTGRPVVNQVGNYVYVLGGSTRGFNPGQNKAQVFPQEICFRAMVNDGSPDVVQASKIGDLLNTPYDYTIQFTEPQVVTRVRGNTFWIEDASRAAALKINPVIWPANGVYPGDKVLALSGNIQTESNTGTYYFRADAMTIDSIQNDVSAIPAPVGMNNRSALTKPGNFDAGRLVKLWGRVTIGDTTMTNDSNSLYFYMDDASGLTTGVDPTINTGIKVYESVYVDTYVAVGDYVSLTGILNYEYDSASKKVVPVLYSDSYLGYSPADRIVNP